MARTFVQQSQISGSLSYNDTLAAGSALAGKQTLVEDLDALRSQLNKIIGGERWYSELSGSQNLADIHAAMVVTGTDADFQGALDVTGVATFDSAITGSAGLQLAGDLDVNSSADFQGAVNLQDTLTVAQAAELNGSLDVAGQVDLAAAGVATNVRGTLSVTENATFSSMTGSLGLKIDGDADFNSSADFQGAVNMQSTLTVAQKADFADIVDVAGTLSASAVKIDGDVVGRLYLVGSEGEIQDSDKLFFDGSLLQVTGSMGVSGGLNVASGGLTVAGDRLEVTGSFGLLGNADLVGDLTISGNVTLGDSSGDIVDVQGTLSASAIKIDGDVAQRLYIVDADGSLKDESKLTFDGSELWVDGDLEVAGGDITMSNSVSLASSALNKLVITASDMVEVSADLKVGGNNIKSSTGATAITLSDDDVEVKGNLQVTGNTVKASSGNNVVTFATVSGVADSVEVAQNLKVTKDLFAVSGSFTGDVTVGGDLYVQGKMTYIETDNLKVKDSIIHLSTGSNSAVPRGLVLHGDDGGGEGDLAFGAKNGGFDFVFAKSVADTFVDSTNAEIFDAAKLAGAWMSKLSVGDLEGSLSGSFEAITTGSLLSSPADLLIAANGQTPISFIESGEHAAFAAQFPGSSLVAAIVAAGGNFKQDSFLPGTKNPGDAIDYSSVEALRAASYATEADRKLAMDVYLNGVRLAYGEDYSLDASGVLTLTMGTMSDDRVLVAIHNAAPTP